MRMVTWISRTVLGMGLAALAFGTAVQAQDFSDVEVTSHKVADGIYMLEGAGGNIGLSVGDDGSFMIDDQFAPLTPKIKAAVSEITDADVTWVLNTHYHPDHVGGNEQWDEMGAYIVAQQNVRARLAAGLAENENATETALPIVTFSEEVTFHWNGQTIEVHHVPHAHTDGDAIIYFREADVIHAGDVFRTTSYPYVDLGAGGSFQGSIDALGKIISIAGPDTRIIPGHGVISSRQDVMDWQTMLVTIRDRVAAAKQGGATLQEVQAMNLTEEYDERWSGRVSAEDIVTVIYNELP